MALATATNALASAFNRKSLQDYARGPLALVSSLSLLLIIRAYGESGQWGSSQIMALSLGMTGSMFLTAGFVTAISRRGSICLGLGDILAARRFVIGLLAVAGCFIGLVAAVVMLSDAGSGAISDVERLTFVLALVGFSAIWLLAGGLSLMQASGWATLGLVLALLVVVLSDYVARTWISFHLELAAALGFATAIAVTSYGLYVGHGELMRKQTGRGSLPTIAYIVDEALPYFSYGSVYMALIVVAHAIGWVGRLGPGESWLPSIVSLEAGLTLSLLPFVLASGLNERALRLFWDRAKQAHAATHGSDPTRFGRALSAFHRQQLRTYLLTMASLSTLVYLAFKWARETGLIQRALGFNVSGTLELFFIAGLILYSLLGWGQFNNSVCLSLNRPDVAGRAALYGIVVALAVGLPPSLLIGFEYSIIGMLAGAVTFVVESHRANAATLRSADYYYLWLF